MYFSAFPFLHFFLYTSLCLPILSTFLTFFLTFFPTIPYTTSPFPILQPFFNSYWLLSIYIIFPNLYTLYFILSLPTFHFFSFPPHHVTSHILYFYVYTSSELYLNHSLLLASCLHLSVCHCFFSLYR